MFHLYELLTFFLRPPRNEYDEEFLGPNFFYLYDKNYYRKDLVIKNRRGENLKCCYFVPFSCNENTPCVVYSHSINGCQLEVLDILHILLICECSVFSFDFAGCGLSEGLYSTGCWNEAQDLFLILNHLRNVEKVKNIALWGKYAGAAISIITAALDKNIKLLILDSPFVSLIELYKTTIYATEKKKSKILIRNFCLYLARKIMIKCFHYDINNVSPIFFIDKITAPTIYIVWENDKFVHPIHSFYLANAQKNANKIIFVSNYSRSIYDIHSYENKLIIAIKSVLYNIASPEHLKKVFDLYTYSKLFNEYKSKNLKEFTLLDKLVIKRKNQKKKIINNVERFICFKFNSQTSITSSRLNQSTMDSVEDFFAIDNEYVNYESTQNKQINNDTTGGQSITNLELTEMRNASINAFPDINKIFEESIESNYSNNTKMQTAHKFDISFQAHNIENDNHPFKLMHMQSARTSSMKSKERKNKKSLTWDSRLHRSASYFKEGCPYELFKDE